MSHLFLFYVKLRVSLSLVDLCHSDNMLWCRNRDIRLDPVKKNFLKGSSGRHFDPSPCISTPKPSY